MTQSAAERTRRRVGRAGPDYSWRCRPEQATENAAGTSVAVNTLVHEQGVPYFVAPLRRSGRDFGDLVPAYVNNPRWCAAPVT
jgi:hypothetical protein